MIRAKPNRWALQRTMTRFALSIGLGGAVFVATQQWVATETAAATIAQSRTVDVLVTTRPIAAGTVLARDDLRWQAWPEQSVDRGWLVRTAKSASASLPMVGQVVPVQLAAGVPITSAMAVPSGNGSAFAAAIRPGWRAATIAVTPAAGLAGFVAPGDRVDVLLTQTLGNRRTAQTLVADLGVLGVDQRQRGDSAVTAPLEAAGDVVASAAGASSAEPPNLITLEVTPRQAEALAVATELGKLSLVLRGPGAGQSAIGIRRWDSDVTGLSPAQLSAGSNTGGGFASAQIPIAPPAPTAPAAPAQRSGGVEIVYGAPPATPEASK